MKKNNTLMYKILTFCLEIRTDQLFRPKINERKIWPLKKNYERASGSELKASTSSLFCHVWKNPDMWLSTATEKINYHTNIASDWSRISRGLLRKQSFHTSRQQFHETVLRGGCRAENLASRFSKSSAEPWAHRIRFTTK